MFSIAMPILWLIAFLVFAIVEGITPTALVSIWFAIGALAALITSALTDSPVAQCVVFLVVSALAFALVRPLARRYFTPKTEATNAQRLVGEPAVVVQRIDNLSASGQVQLRGQVWSARNETDEVLEAGSRVTVLRIEGVKLIVQRAES
jgi:membrane protein implicated in regulation of membrane protease activity